MGEKRMSTSNVKIYVSLCMYVCVWARTRAWQPFNILNLVRSLRETVSWIFLVRIAFWMLIPTIIPFQWHWCDSNNNNHNRTVTTNFFLLHSHISFNVLLSDGLVSNFAVAHNFTETRTHTHTHEHRKWIERGTRKTSKQANERVRDSILLVSSDFVLFSHESHDIFDTLMCT